MKSTESIDWNAIVVEHGGLVWQTVDCILRNAAEVEDCFQETFLAAVKVARHRHIDNWPALLRHIATRRAIDQLRNRSHRRKFVESARLVGVASSGTTPERVLESAELAEQLRIAMAQLPPRYAEVFSLHDLLGQSHEEIAATMKLRPGAVRVLLHRSRERLRKLLPTGDQ